MAAIHFQNDDPENFYALIDESRFDRIDPVSLRLLARYYRAYFGPDCLDLSFAIEERGKAEIVVPCQLIGSDLKNNGTYIVIHAAPGALTRQKTQLLMETLQETAQRHGVKKIAIRTESPDGTLDLSGDRLFKAGATPMPLFASAIDLTQSLADIRKGIRKSYSSLINWGEQALQMVVLDKDNPDRGLYDRVQAFHAHVAGRVTRSQESWDVHFDMIAAGRAELLTGFLDGALVSAALYLDEGRSTVYGVGIYERSLFDKPLAHALTWQGISRARERGQTRFNVGDVYPKTAVDDKQYRIGDFKKGFSPALKIDLGWDWAFDGPPGNDNE